MPAPLPEPARVLQGIETYLRLAYEGNPPQRIQSQLDTLRALPSGEFFASPLFARDPHEPPTRYSLRLGNKAYPHMKLGLELSPDDSQFLFKADAHDRHVCPLPTSPEHAAFCKLMENNQKLTEAIEAAWAKQGLPTFKTYLENDLTRRRAEMAETKPASATLSKYTSGLDD